MYILTKEKNGIFLKRDGVDMVQGFSVYSEKLELLVPNHSKSRVDTILSETQKMFLLVTTYLINRW